jgi:hypothetical protein
MRLEGKLIIKGAWLMEDPCYLCDTDIIKKKNAELKKEIDYVKSFNYFSEFIKLKKRIEVLERDYEVMSQENQMLKEEVFKLNSCCKSE